MNTIDSIKHSSYKTISSSVDIYAINLKCFLATIALTKMHPISPVFRAYIFNDITNFTIEESAYNELTSMCKSLLKDYKKSNTGKAVFRKLGVFKKKLELKREIEGMSVSSISLTSIDMRKIDLLPTGSKVLLLDFCRTYCRSCKLDHSHLVRLQKKFQSKGFSVVLMKRKMLL